MTGWTPHPTQQQPAKRGSQTVNFMDLERELGSGPKFKGLDDNGNDDTEPPAAGKQE